MKIFLSWSGERSRLVAEAFRTWLPDVISFFDPWISSEDIERGARWGADLGLQLQTTQVGIICITPENLNAPWILFEAGALAKTLDRSRVCTYLFDLQPSDLTGPLVQFQATLATRAETLKLVQTLNSQLGENARSPQQVERVFDRWWPELERSLQAIPRFPQSAQTTRADRELLEELLDMVRQQMKMQDGLLGTAASRKLDEGPDVSRLAELEFTDDPGDPNATEWATSSARDYSDLETLNGRWSSRWYEAPDDEWGEIVWNVGSATFVAHDRYFVVIHTGLRGDYLMIGRRDASGRLVGRHYNVNNSRDSWPWVGIVKNEHRIDGRWTFGRWDFQRLPTADQDAVE